MEEQMYKLECYITVDKYDVLQFVASKPYMHGECVESLQESGYKITKNDIRDTIKAKLEKGVSRSDFDFVSMSECDFSE